MILPLVASYPIIERIWLRRHLESDTVTKHAQIDAEEHPQSYRAAEWAGTAPLAWAAGMVKVKVAPVP